MKSNNILTNIIDEDNIISKLPIPTLSISIDLDNKLLILSGNISIVKEISKMAYIGPSKNTLQEYNLSKIYINFDIDDSINKIEYSSTYEPINTTLSSSIFVVNHIYKISDNFNLVNFNIKSFKIIANYIYGNNNISSVVTLKNPIIIGDKPKIENTCSC